MNTGRDEKSVLIEQICCHKWPSAALLEKGWRTAPQLGYSQYLRGLLCRVDPEVHGGFCRRWDDIYLEKTKTQTKTETD